MTSGAIEWIEIPVVDLDRDPAFYEQVFGWKIQREGAAHDHTPTYVMFQDPSGNVGGGMYREITPAPEGGPQVYVSVDSIDVTLKAIEASGGTITKERTLIDENVGWWAGFKDPAGNRMFLYESSHAHPHE